LVSRVLSGVKGAEEALYMRHAGPVLALCLRLLGDRDEAEDVLQETFLEVFEALHTLPKPSQLARWITGIVVSKTDALFRRRRARRLTRSLASAGASFLRPSPEATVEVREQLAQLDTKLSALRDRDRACFLLHVVDGFALAELAELTHRPLSIVRRRLQRADRALQLHTYPALTPPLLSLLDQSRPENARELLRVFLARRELRARSPRPLSRWLRSALGVGLVLSLMLLGVDKNARHEASPLTMRDQRSLPSTMLTNTRHHAFDLSDGSRLTLAPGARVDVVDSTARELVLAQRGGRVRFDIQEGARHAFRIECGPLSAHTEGAKLIIERTAHSLAVQVEQGNVVLRGAPIPDRVQRLTAGQRFTVELAAE
jgi:RNA polymerase sigma-70 factor (ECF subfamily)